VFCDVYTQGVTACSEISDQNLLRYVEVRSKIEERLLDRADMRCRNNRGGQHGGLRRSKLLSAVTPFCARRSIAAHPHRRHTQVAKTPDDNSGSFREWFAATRKSDPAAL
jgi:hypothetical protein